MARLYVAWIASLTKVSHAIQVYIFCITKNKHTHTQGVWTHLNENFTRIPLNLSAVCTNR